MNITITQAQALDKTTCPVCSSKNIGEEDSGCLCRIPNHSCWTHPVCNDCEYTAGGGAGNSDGGMLVTFSTPYAETYVIQGEQANEL